MLIEKEVFNKINTVNKNLNKLAKYNSHPYENESKGEILIKSLTNDLSYIVGKINETYETFIKIVYKEVEDKD